MTGRQHRQQGRCQQLTQGGGGADVDHRPVVGATLAPHDGAVGELPSHFLDHHSRRATHRSDGQTGEHEGDRATDEEADESGRIGDVDRRLRQGEQLRSFGDEPELTCDRLDESSEEGHSGDDSRSDGEPLGDRLGGVAHCIEADHHFPGFAMELTGHLGDAGGIVGDRSESVLGDHDTGRSEHPHPGQGDQVERELDVAAAEEDRNAEGAGDGDDGPHRRLETR